MTKPIGMASVTELSKYARRAERMEQVKDTLAWVAKARRAVVNVFAGIGAAVVFFGAIACTSDETRPALISVADLRRLISAERIKAVKEIEEALKAKPEPGTLRGFFNLPRKTS